MKMNQNEQLKKRGRPQKNPPPAEVMTTESATTPEETQSKGTGIKRAAKAVLSSVIERSRPVRASATKARSTIKDAFTNPFTKTKKQRPKASHSDQDAESGNQAVETQPAATDLESVDSRHSSPALSTHGRELGADEFLGQPVEGGTVPNVPEPIAHDEPAEARHSLPISPTDDTLVRRDETTLEQAVEAGAVVVVPEGVPDNESLRARQSPPDFPIIEQEATRDGISVEVDAIVGTTGSINGQNEYLETRQSPPVPNVEPQAGRDGDPNANAEEEVRNEVFAPQATETVPDAVVEGNQKFLDELEFPPAYEDEDGDTEAGTGSAEVDLSKLVNRKITPLERFKPLFENAKQMTTPQLYLTCGQIQGVLAEWQDEWMALDRHIQGPAAKEPKRGTWEGDEDHKQAVLAGYLPKPEESQTRRGRKNKRPETTLPWALIAPTFPEPDWGRQTRQSTRKRGRPENLEINARTERSTSAGRRRRMAKSTAGHKRSAPAESPEKPETEEVPETVMGAEAIVRTTGRKRRRLASAQPDTSHRVVSDVSPTAPAPTAAPARAPSAPAATNPRGQGRKRSAPAVSPEEPETEEVPETFTGPDGIVRTTGTKRRRLASAQPDTSHRVVSDVAPATVAAPATAPTASSTVPPAPRRRGRPPKVTTENTPAAVASTAASAPKRRGRPPKKTTAKAKGPK